jgi:hypothetical protein
MKEEKSPVDHRAGPRRLGIGRRTSGDRRAKPSTKPVSAERRAAARRLKARRAKTDRRSGRAERV